MTIEPLDKRNKEDINLNSSKMVKLNKLGINYYVFAMSIKEIKKSIIENNVLALNNGYSYIQILPIEKNYSLTMIYDEKGKITNYKFDITLNNFVDERGLPFYEKSDLSIIVDNTLNVSELGVTKVEEAFASNKLNKEQYDLIMKEAQLIKLGIKETVQALNALSIKYYNLFFERKKGNIIDNRNTQRKNIKPGIKVAIVLKKDQKTGILTEGIVKEILTNSLIHHRGIKVRLMDGQVGRVQKIL